MPTKKINAEKIRSFKYLINKIEEKHPTFKDKPKCALLIGAGCSFKSKVPLGGGIIDICQRLSFLKNETTGTSALVKKFFETGDAEPVNEYIANNNLADDLANYIANKQLLLKQRILNEKDIEIKKLKEFVCDFDWEAYEALVVEDGGYGFWMDELDNDPRERQRLIEALIDKKEPSGAYILLAYMIERGVFTNILTTNFDDFINDALSYYTDTKCRFYADDELSQYISVYSSKPNIIKLHGDYRFVNIKNTGEETMRLSKNLELKMGELLQNFSIIVVGYNGADHSIMNALNRIKQNNKYELIWCGLDPEQVHWRVAHLINCNDNSFFIKIEGFDELMGQLYPHFSKESKPQNLLTKAEVRQKQVDAILQQYAREFEESAVSDKEKEEFNRSKLIEDAFNRAFQEKDPATQIALYNDVLKLDEKNAAVYNNLGVIWAEKSHAEDKQKALEYYNKAIELLPDYVLAYLNRGLYWKGIKEYTKAVEDFTKIISLSPGEASNYSGRADIWYEIDDFTKAIEDYTQAISIAPNNASYYNNRGNSWHSKKEYDKAIEDYDRALRIKPHEALYYNNRGNSFHAKEEYDRAIEDYDKAISIKGDEAVYYRNRASNWQSKKNYDNAILDLQMALKLQPDSASFHNSLSNTYRLKGDLATARQLVNEGLVTFPDYAYLHTTSAEIYAQQGQTEHFYTAIQKALELGAPVWTFLEDGAYAAYKNEKRFTDLLAQYHKEG